MNHLYLQIYLTVVGVLVIFILLSSLSWWFETTGPSGEEFFEGAARSVAAVLPDADAPRVTLEERLQEVVGPFGADATVFTHDGIALASAGNGISRAEFLMNVGRGAGELEGPGLWGRPRRGVVVLALPDSRVFILRVTGDRGAARRHLGTLLLAGLAIAIGAFPIVRRLTHRLESLQSKIDAFGKGELQARVEVEGRDEIADLAKSFNRSAERIEELVEDKKRALATTSHELRTPLARIRVAAELLAQDPRPELSERIERDICELDELIAELLLASQLDSRSYEMQLEPVDLLAILAEEASRLGVEVMGEGGTLSGNPQLLRRLVRNLLENAERHAGGATDARLERSDDGGWLLAISDRGPGVAQDELERIFEPFQRAATRTTRGETRDSTAGAGGLGLALVRQIAERHGGAAHCHAREGGGLRFEVQLPESDDAPAG